jgi:hypothetical protein
VLLHGSNPRATPIKTRAALIAIGMGVITAACWPGSGAANVDAGQVTIGAIVPGRLYPGAGEPVILKATNPNSSPVFITSIHLIGISLDDAQPGCNASQFSMAAVLEDAQVPAGAKNYQLPQAGMFVYRDSDGDQDACAGVQLTLKLSSN